MLEPETAAPHDGAVDHLGDFVEPSLVLLRSVGTALIGADDQRRTRPGFRTTPQCACELLNANALITEAAAILA